MNLVPIEAWSFSKVDMNSLGLAATSSNLARGAGYGMKLEVVSFMGNGLLLAQEVDAAIAKTITPHPSLLCPSLFNH